MRRKLAGRSGLLLFLVVGAAQAQWRPVTAEDLAAKPPASDPNADAVALFRDVRVLNEAATFGYPHNVIHDYMRLKIFTARGRDKYATVQIPFWGKTVISNVAGRTVKPDGSIIELKKEDVFEKVIEKRKGGPKTQTISFALPAVEPGSIIEYRYTKNVGEFISRYLPLELQEDVPVREVDIHIKPVTGQWVKWPTMRFLPFGCKVEDARAEGAGFSGFVVRDLPAFHQEPFSPPAFYSKQWVLFYYEDNDQSDPARFWSTLARKRYDQYSPEIKIDKEVRQIANEETTGANTDVAKVDRLFEYCRKNLKDVHGIDITTEERDKAKENHNSTNTLRNREGTLSDLNVAFIALATAAGYEAHLAQLPDRSQVFFDPRICSGFFLQNTAVAVKIRDSWRFYTFADPWAPPGQLPWQEQGVKALIESKDGGAFADTPLLSADNSAVQRIGTFTLSPDGTFEGDIREIFIGNKAAEFRHQFALANDAEREAIFRDEMKHRFSDFELSNIKFTLSSDLKLGVGVTYHVKVPKYCERTGKRLFVKPGFFSSGHQSRFVETDRKLPVYFPYPWSESDYVELQLPEGFRLDHPDAPAPIKSAPVVTYSVSMAVTKSNKLIYQRQLMFGGNSVPLFEAANYAVVKKIFDHIHESDDHIVTLKSEAPGATETQSSAVQ
jgi:hypothetical protein